MDDSLRSVFGPLAALGLIGSLFAAWEKLTAPSYFACALNQERYGVTSSAACNHLADDAGTYLVPSLVAAAISLVVLVVLSRRSASAPNAQRVA